MNVEGIGEKKLKAITEWIKVGEYNENSCC